MKNFWKVLAIVLSVITLLGVFISLFGDSMSFGRDVNPDNLIDVKDKNYIKTHDTNRGVDIKVNDDGVITLSGKASSDYSVKVAEVRLEAGTYTISGLNDPDVNDFRMYVAYSGGSAFAGTDNATFTLAAAETVTVTIAWAEDHNFNLFTGNKVYPVIVEGDEAGSFWAERK